MRSKEELINENVELWERVDQLESEVEFWKAECGTMEEELGKDLDETIDVNDFIRRLKIDNLYDEKMESIIEEYLKFYRR